MKLSVNVMQQHVSPPHSHHLLAHPLAINIVPAPSVGQMPLAIKPSQEEKPRTHPPIGRIKMHCIVPIAGQTTEGRPGSQQWLPALPEPRTATG